MRVIFGDEISLSIGTRCLRFSASEGPHPIKQTQTPLPHCITFNKEKFYGDLNPDP